jgi:hypothetical protein
MILEPVVRRPPTVALQGVTVPGLLDVKEDATPEHPVDAENLRAVRILGSLALGVMLAVDGRPLLGHHPGAQPQPEAEKMRDQRMQIQGTVRLMTVQKNGHRSNGHVRQSQCGQYVCPPGPIDYSRVHCLSSRDRARDSKAIARTRQLRICRRTNFRHTGEAQAPARCLRALATVASRCAPDRGGRESRNAQGRHGSGSQWPGLRVRFIRATAPSFRLQLHLGQCGFRFLGGILRLFPFNDRGVLRRFGGGNGFFCLTLIDARHLLDFSKNDQLCCP